MVKKITTEEKQAGIAALSNAELKDLIECGEYARVELYRRGYSGPLFLSSLYTQKELDEMSESVFSEEMMRKMFELRHDYDTLANAHKETLFRSQINNFRDHAANAAYHILSSIIIRPYSQQAFTQEVREWLLPLDSATRAIKSCLKDHDRSTDSVPGLPEFMEPITEILEAANMTVDSNYSGYDEGVHLSDIGPKHHKNLPTIIQMVNIDQEQAEKQIRQKALIDALTPAQRRDGLIKWGIAEMMDEKGGTQLPAARLLRERLENFEKHSGLTDEQKQILLHLQILLNGANPGSMIGKLMNDNVLAVPWGNSTIRL